jgi:glycosyltransferase involved in cell wall biosynthesis
MAAFPSRTWKLLVGERNADPNIFKSRKLMAYRWFHLVADYVVSNSHENIKMVKKINPLLSDNKCRVIYNMVDFERWKPSENFEYRNKDKFSLIVVANHQESKNAKGLVHALHLLPSKYKDQIKVDWFGRRDSFELEVAYAEAESLVKEFQLENVISFFDPSLSIHEIVPDYDALGLFSFHEGLSNSVCEGMASGKPIISTDVSDIKLIIKNGFNGFVVDSCQPESIKNALIKLLDCSNEDLAKMGKNAGITATELFNKETVVSAYIDLMLK